jgi:hypothetical protein
MSRVHAGFLVPFVLLCLVIAPLTAPSDVSSRPPPTPPDVTDRMQETGNGSAAISVPNQISDGTRAYIRNATLPDGGFLVVEANGTVRGVSAYLEAGRYSDRTIEFDPRHYICSRDRITVTAYRDSGDRTFDETDEPYIRNGSVVTDTAEYEPLMESPYYIIMDNQTTGSETVTVRYLKTPPASFLVLLDSDPATANMTDHVRGVVKPSEQQGNGPVTVNLSEPLRESQRLYPVVVVDADGNGQLNFRTDVPLTYCGEPGLREPAMVTVETPTPTSTGTTTETRTTPPTSGPTDEPTRTTTASGPGFGVMMGVLVLFVMLIGGHLGRD